MDLIKRLQSAGVLLSIIILAILLVPPRTVANEPGSLGGKSGSTSHKSQSNNSSQGANKPHANSANLKGTSKSGDARAAKPAEKAKDADEHGPQPPPGPRLTDKSEEPEGTPDTDPRPRYYPNGEPVSHP